jgi:sugar lactone lactonase YvrE
VLLTDSGLDATFAGTGADALYHVMGDRYGTVISGGDLGAPNGVAVKDGEAYVVTFMTGQLLHVTGENEYAEALVVEGGQFDGIEFLEDGRALVSNWATSCVHILDTDGTLTCAMPDIDAPADIGVDHQRGRVLVPLFNANEVRILPLG